MNQIARLTAGILTAAALLLAQDGERPDFVNGVTIVQVPVSVRDTRGNYVLGLTPTDFQLLDEGVPQRNVKLDVTSYPISLVVVVQANSSAAQALPLVKRVADLIPPVIAGENGEVALIAFDDRVQVLQPFTSETDKVKKAFEALKPGNKQQRLDDAAMEGINMLRTRSKDRKKVLLLISETRDSGSRFNPRDVLTKAEFSDVQVHSVSMSHLINILTTPTLPNRPNPVPPEQRNPLPMGNLQTPTSDAQTNMGNIVPLFKEIFEAAKGAAVPNSLEVYSNFTGGLEQDFVSVTGLEEAVARIGEEIHTQYLLTFSPQAGAKGGYHRLEVKVLSAANYRITTRLGYWWASATPAAGKRSKK